MCDTDDEHDESRLPIVILICPLYYTGVIKMMHFKGKSSRNKIFRNFKQLSIHKK